MTVNYRNYNLSVKRQHDKTLNCYQLINLRRVLYFYLICNGLRFGNFKNHCMLNDNNSIIHIITLSYDIMWQSNHKPPKSISCSSLLKQQ